GYDYMHEYSYGVVMVGGDTKNPEALVKQVKQTLFEAVMKKQIDDEALQRAKKRKIGSFLRALNSPEFIANQFTRYAFNDMDFFTIPDEVERISAEDCVRALAIMATEEQCATCTVVPKK
ncbi:MAG: EF-P 5-aminopentanol modification-associated protein YfmH, partial [Bacilli bacterium]